MAYGLMVEPVIRDWYMKTTGFAVFTPTMPLKHPEHAFIVASVDGIAAVDLTIKKDQEPSERVLEIKTARSDRDWGEPGTDAIPVYYMTQIQHYLMVTALELADVAVSFSGSMPVLYHVEADKELQEMLLEAEIAFWKRVIDRDPPEPVTYSDMIAKFGKKSVSNAVTAPQEVLDAVMQLRSIREVMKDLEAQEEAAKTVILGALGENDTLIDVDGKTLATWRLAKAAQRFDTKAFQAEHKELYQQYLVTGEPSRRFLLK